MTDDFPAWSVEFARHFDDRCHHQNEEDVLFPLLEQRGIHREGDSVVVMLMDHEQNRECVRRMNHAVQKHDDAVLLRQHIAKEYNVQFPMAERCIANDEDAQLVERFDAVEHEKGGHELHGKFVQEIQRWKSSFP